MSEILTRKRKNVAIISSSDDDSSRHSVICKNEKNANDNNQLLSCKVNLIKIEDSTDKQIKKKQRRIHTKFQEDSSDDNVPEHSERTQLSFTTASKIQTQRKKLEKLCQKKRSKTRSTIRRQQCSGSSDEFEVEEINEVKDVKPLYTEEEEENLPIFKHEDKVPDSDMSSDDEKNFINDEEESVDSHSNFENEEDSDDNSEDSNSYVNPYMERNKDIEREDILKVLSKSTEKDKSNQKRYKKEIGKYQLEIHSKKNRAHRENPCHISNRQRKNRIMKATRHDEALKEERNIDVGNDEFYYNRAITLMGSKVQVFPHTKRVAKYSSRCDLYACNDKFTARETEVVGIKKYSEFDLRFRKKPNQKSAKESFYWICASHCPPSVWKEETSSSSSSEDE